MASILALTSAFFYGSSNVLTTLGMLGADRWSAILISQIFCLVLSLGTALWVTPPGSWWSPAVAYFVAAGLLGPFAARSLLYVGLHRTGASVATTLYQTKPLFAALAAVWLLSEPMTAPIVGGMLLMFAGTVAISYQRPCSLPGLAWSKADLAYPLAAGVLFGLAQVTRKIGLGIDPSPLLGVAVQNVFALAAPAALSLRKAGPWVTSSARAWFHFGAAGAGLFLGQVCLFFALSQGPVVLVAPLSSLEPFVVLVLASLLLRKSERITPKIVLGSVLITAGTAVLALRGAG